MSRDYPNMSYCMFENTMLAMRQIIMAMEDEQLEIKDLNRTEQDALRQMIFDCSKLLEYAEDQGYA